MARAAKKTKAKPSAEFSLFDAPDADEAEGAAEVPRDEVGREKIKQQYVELLGIRTAKLKGRILNRERITKTVEGIYFICSLCERVCHNLDEGLVEDADNVDNRCTPCHKTAISPPVVSRAKSSSGRTKSAAARKRKPVRKATKAKAKAKS